MALHAIKTLFAAAVVPLFLLCSCATFQEAWLEALDANSINGKPKKSSDPIEKLFNYEYAYLIGFYPMPLNDDDGFILTGIPDAGSQELIWVHKVPQIQARDVEEIDYYPSPTKKGFMRIRLRLTDKGRKRWMAMTGKYTNWPIAIVIDGEYHRTYVPKHIISGNERWVEIEGVDFPPKLSRNLRKHATRNCKHFNQTPFNFFGGEQ